MSDILGNITRKQLHLRQERINDCQEGTQMTVLLQDHNENVTNINSNETSTLQKIQVHSKEFLMERYLVDTVCFFSDRHLADSS